ncbi:hypothetical protein O181_076970 [Austropuccinia psidii MF-1]|uniref:Chromo domain-containing protein n=1 Tax=Austropuccinia psidii MF-1 TaxID=1389203 RepID=A0A9Q3F9U4_9BASI|nr:hypothetical protein [Austropuccinia psidii MF-1]
MYVSYSQDDWHTWISMAEFSYNNSDHPSTKQYPFFTVYGRDPQLDLVHITQDTPFGKLSSKIQAVQKDTKRELEFSINMFKMYADKSRTIPPVFNPGYMLGLFPTLKKVSTHSYHLNGNPSTKSSIFPSLNQSRHQEPPPQIIIEEEEEWEVPQILYSKLKRGKVWYLVECKGFSQGPEIFTWESYANLNNCPEMVINFHKLYPEKSGQYSSRP